MKNIDAGICLFALLLAVNPAPSAAQDQNLLSAETAIQKRIAASGADVAIFFHTLDGAEAWSLRSDQVFHAASTMKLPVMIELFYQAQRGKLKLDDSLPIKNEFHSMVDGSPYTLNAADDSETDLYKAEGQTRTLRQLCELMITVSSNFAANLLIEKLGVDNIRVTVHQYGADGMNVLRGVEDGKAFERGLNNTTTAQALGALMQAIADGKAVDPASSREMVEILKRQKFHDAIPAGLPAGIAVAHKTGDITKINHDAAIVYAKRPYILVILTRGLGQQKDSAELMADISRQLYQATQ